jgi:DUF1680 family protein
MAYCHIHEGSAGVSAFPLTGRSRLLTVHFNTRAYQPTSFAFDLSNAVKVTGSGELRAVAVCSDAFHTDSIWQ